MKPTTKTLFATLLLFLITSGIMAQEKYGYAIVEHDYRNVTVTKHTVELFPISKNDTPNAEVVKKVDEMSKDGWEVFNTAVRHDPNLNRPVHAFYLRKKVKE